MKKLFSHIKIFLPFICQHVQSYSKNQGESLRMQLFNSNIFFIFFALIVTSEQCREWKMSPCKLPTLVYYCAVSKSGVKNEDPHCSKLQYLSYFTNIIEYLYYLVDIYHWGNINLGFIFVDFLVHKLSSTFQKYVT